LPENNNSTPQTCAYNVLDIVSENKGLDGEKTIIVSGIPILGIENG